MDHSSTAISWSLLIRKDLWRINESIEDEKVRFYGSDMHLAAVNDYFISLYPSCNFSIGRFARLLNVIFSYGSSRIRAKIVSQELHPLFRVPRLKSFIERENRIKKHQLVRVFLTFLGELLYHKTDSLHKFKYQVENLEKELKFLLTVLGDNSLMLHEEEFHNLTAEFEAAANQAGRFIHSLLFSTHRSFGKMEEGYAVVLNHINLLKNNTMRFLNLLPCTIKTAYTNSGTYVVDLLILDSLVHDLEDLISGEDKRINCVKEQIRVLHQGLTFLQSSIKDAWGPQPSKNGEFKKIVKRIGNMAHEIEYLIVSFSSGDAPLWYIIKRLTVTNQKIELVASELQEITKKHKLGELKVAEDSNAQDPENIEIDEVIVGFKDREVDVLDYLIGGRESLHVISIFGMPGLGKTTLAKKLFYHPSVNNWFDKKSWCVVSQKYESQSIRAEVLTQINGEFGKDITSKMDTESLVVEIHKTLYRRRYLIVLDDVWDSNLWDDLMGCFPDNGNGSRILFTTRNKDVGPSNCRNYALSSLSNEECWELLKKKVFGNNTCPPKLIGIGKAIAADCWGLPLAVVAVAGILSTMDKEMFLWKQVRGNLASNVFDGGDNSVMQVLELSYKHLPQRLKPCFLYLRAFARHKEIQVGKLTRLWISEGFIHKEEGKSAEDVAEEYLMELINKSLVMVAKKRSDGGVKTCLLHELLRDLCSKICGDEDFLKIEESNIHSVYENGLPQPLDYAPCTRYITWSYCQQVRSLHAEYHRSHPYVGRMRSLRVLHYNHISDHLTGLQYLVNLKYLVIRDLPASIGSLVKLEYLRVESEEIIYLPPEIFRMVKLRYLNVYIAGYDGHCNSSHKNSLEFLSNISIRNVEDEEMLKCSPNLRKLKCMYICEGPSPRFDLGFFSHLDSLRLALYGPGVTEICFPSNIRKLILSGWQYLPWEKMSIIGRLEKLEVLKLGLFSGSEEERWDTRDGEFQKLKFLKLDRLQNLTEWNVDSSGHFPALQRLVLRHCENLQEIPCEIGEIATLQLIEVKGYCAESLVESANLVQQQQLEMGNEGLRVVIINKKY